MSGFRRPFPITISSTPVFVFPAESGLHLLTPEGWKAELARALQSESADYCYMADITVVNHSNCQESRLTGEVGVCSSPPDSAGRLPNGCLEVPDGD